MSSAPRVHRRFRRPFPVSGSGLLALGLLLMLAESSPRAEEHPTHPSSHSAPDAEGALPADLPATAIDSAAGAAGSAPNLQRGRVTSPMAIEMTNLLEDERRSLLELQVQFRGARDEVTALEVQRRIEQLKVGTEISLLRIQARWARKDGRIEQAALIEAAIEETLHPRPPLAPALRRDTDGERALRPAPQAPAPVDKTTAPAPIGRTSDRAGR